MQNRLPRPIWIGILVHYIHGASCRIHHCVSHELVVGIPTHEARHDDGTITQRVCKGWSAGQHLGHTLLVFDLGIQNDYFNLARLGGSD